jgi:type IV secretory pathway VirB10-like protein
MAKRRGLKPWMIATPLATGINLVLLAFLAQGPPADPIEPAPPMIVTFELPPRDPRTRNRSALRRDPEPPVARPAAGSAAAVDPPPPQPLPAAGPPASAPNPWQVSDAARLQAFGDSLRAQRACAAAPGGRLTQEERARCLADWEASAERAAVKWPSPQLNLDPKGRFVRETQPYLERKPKNGCKVRAGGTPVPAFGDQGVATGVACAFSF